MRCVIYIRVSTVDQAERDGEEGFSLPAQREACIRHIRDQGWDLVDEYSDRGESARSADRPQLQAMLSRIHEQGDVDAVLVHKLDRLARNMEDHPCHPGNAPAAQGHPRLESLRSLRRPRRGSWSRAFTPSWPSSSQPTSRLRFGKG